MQTHWPSPSLISTPLSSMLALGKHQLRDNSVWEVLWIQSSHLSPHSLVEPLCTLMARWLKAWSKLLPFCALSPLVSLWKGCSIARRSCFFLTVKTYFFLIGGTDYILSYTRVYFYVSHSSYHCTVSFINTEIVFIHNWYPLLHLRR